MKLLLFGTIPSPVAITDVRCRNYIHWIFECFTRIQILEVCTWGLYLDFILRLLTSWNFETHLVVNVLILLKSLGITRIQYLVIVLSSKVSLWNSSVYSSTLSYYFLYNLKKKRFLVVKVRIYADRIVCRIPLDLRGGYL